jgi:TRAP-type C4-dicarboxylate transport system permease large subunit
MWARSAPLSRRVQRLPFFVLFGNIMADGQKQRDLYDFLSTEAIILVPVLTKNAVTIQLLVIQDYG